MKALVTGGTGFIGSHVVDQLVEAKHMVRIFSRRHEMKEGLERERVEFFQGNLEDVDSLFRAMEGIDVVFHIGEIKNTTKAAAERNIALMEKITGNIEQSGCGRLVFISSITVAGMPSVMPADEDTVPEVILKDHYTVYKKRCEELLIDRSNGFEYVIIRPAPVYGPGSRYLGKLIDALDYLGPIGFPFIGNGQNYAPLVYVRDLARFICLSGIHANASGQIFILTDGIRHSWYEFFRSITESLGKKLRLLPVPPLLLKFPSIPLDLFSGLFGFELDTVSYIDYFSKNLYFDNSKARNLLDWKPEYTLDQGIEEMIKHYRA